jgi:hypothetical protein
LIENEKNECKNEKKEVKGPYLGRTSGGTLEAQDILGF